ncbi:MAG: stage II sporulation protein M [Acidobacteriota bacterium]
MILDMERFVRTEEPYWRELETFLAEFERNPNVRMDAVSVPRFHYLYQRATTCLARLASNSGDPEVRAWLESLVARAYGEIHRRPARGGGFSFRRWLTAGFPQAFRRHLAAFRLSLAITIAGTAFGAAVLAVSPEAKATLMPFGHLMEKPHERVAREEKEQASREGDRIGRVKGSFSAELMTHNIRVSVLTLGMGMTWGAGVIVLLFYNGVSLGAVASDYVMDGQAKFLMGWLMPHGVIEIPAILVAGQAGFVLAAALVGWRSRETRRRRLAAARADVASLAGGFAVMLIWAGVIEAFVSQYHQPVLPYSLKIAFGTVELSLLCAYFAWAGREKAGAVREKN